MCGQIRAKKTTFTPLAVHDFGKPAPSDADDARIVSSVTSSSFLGMFTFASVAVVLITFVIVLYAVMNRKKRALNSDQNLADAAGED